MASETLAWAAGLGLLGPIIGSFLGLVSLRWPQGRPIAMARSACPACGRKLSPLELVPLVSYLVQRGECRACGAQIDPRYPLIEVGCALIGVWAGLAMPGWEGALTAALGWTLVLIAVLDAEHFWLPDALTLPLLAAGLAHAVATGDWQGRLIGAVAGFASLALVAWAYARLRGVQGLGGGDPKLFAACGAWVGWIGLPSVMLWAAAAAFSVLAAQRIARRPISGATRLPLGAYLAVGLWFVWLYGPLGAPSG
jgi:leader peptidase (prepilin peptidase)/N-methyltransferase